MLTRWSSASPLSLFLCVSVSSVSAQDARLDSNAQFSDIVASVALSVEGARQSAIQELDTTRQTVEFLTKIDPSTGLTQAFVFSDVTGLADDMAEYSERQSETIDTYSDSMNIRLQNLSNLWDIRNESRVSSFLETSSLYDIEELPTESIFDNVDEFVPAPDYFPGFYVPPGGFFSLTVN